MSFKYKLLLWKMYILPHFLYFLPSLMGASDKDDMKIMEQAWRTSVRKCIGLP